jgi:DNA-binding transcriptional MocR family regulator
VAQFNKLKYLQLLRHASLTHAEYRVLVTLLTYASKDGSNAHPGYRRLAEECRMSNGTVSKAVKQLKAAGWLWETSRGTKGERGRIAAVFELRIPTHLSPKKFPEGNAKQFPDSRTSSQYKPPDSEDPWGSVAV